MKSLTFSKKKEDVRTLLVPIPYPTSKK